MSFWIGYVSGFITGPIALIGILYLLRNVTMPILFMPDD